MSECTKCGACCVAPDISALGKPLGVRCPHLTADNLCGIYERRPRICRDYAADWLCERIAAPTLDERVERYLEVFGLEGPVRNVQLVQLTARNVPVVQLVQAASDSR